MTVKAQIFVEGLDHSEGVAVDPEGQVWCGGEAGQIYRIDPETKKIEEVANTGGFVLGIAFAPDLSWLAICDAGNHALMRLELATMQVSMLANRIGDWNLNLPNYPTFARDGTLYVSESGHVGQIDGRVFRFDREGNAALWAGGELNFANGLTLDAEQAYLYVVESFLPGISRFKIQRDGTAGPREVVTEEVPEVPDGLAFDVEGNLYCSCYAPSRIYKIDPQRQVSVLDQDVQCHYLSNCTNIAFGGPEFRTLYVANIGRWHLSQIAMPTPGLPLACHPRG